jgi:hypothetical protein
MKLLTGLLSEGFQLFHPDDRTQKQVVGGGRAFSGWTAQLESEVKSPNRRNTTSQLDPSVQSFMINDE